MQFTILHPCIQRGTHLRHLKRQNGKRIWASKLSKFVILFIVRGRCGRCGGAWFILTENKYLTLTVRVISHDNHEEQDNGHYAVKDISRRKCNVVITGLRESSVTDSSRASDHKAFLQLCEEHLSIKPNVAPQGCRRLGRSTDQQLAAGSSSSPACSSSY